MTATRGTHFEVVKIGKEWCLRVKATKRPVAWSTKDDAVWRSYVAEAQADALVNPYIEEHHVHPDHQS